MLHTWQREPSAGPWLHESMGGAALGGLGVALVEVGTRAAWFWRE
jgi:hypothetical protein